MMQRAIELRTHRASWLTILALAIFFLPVATQAQSNEKQPTLVDSFAADVIADFRRHYSLKPLGRVALGIGITGIVANTNADENIQDWFDDHLDSNAGDNLADFFDNVGDVAHPLYAFPIYLGVMWLGDYRGENESIAAQWGANSMRAVLVGAPEVIVFSNVLGGNRPEQGDAGWDPFDEDNAVSGHAFLGAVPIITAAKLTTTPWLKYTLYATSTLPGLARVYDDKHYFSQSLLGWWIAYVATESVEHTNNGMLTDMQLTPVAYADGGGVQLAFSF